MIGGFVMTSLASALWGWWASDGALSHLIFYHCSLQSIAVSHHCWLNLNIFRSSLQSLSSAFWGALVTSFPVPVLWLAAALGICHNPSNRHNPAGVIGWSYPWCQCWWTHLQEFIFINCSGTSLPFHIHTVKARDWESKSKTARQSREDGSDNNN